MEKYNISFWIAQGLSLVSVIIYVFSWSKKEHKDILKFQVFGNSFNISSLIFLDAYSGMLMSVITFTRNVINIFKDKIEWVKSPFTMYAFMTALVLGIIPVWKGPISLLPCMACLLGTYSVSLSDTIKMKKYMFIACALWIPYNWWVLAYVGAMSNVLVCTSIYYYFKKEERIKKAD